MTKSESSSSQSSPKMLRMMSVMLAKKPSLSLLVRGGEIVKRRSLSWLNAWLASLKMVMV